MNELVKQIPTANILPVGIRTYTGTVKLTNWGVENHFY